MVQLTEQAKVREIVAYLETNNVVLPNGGRLTPRRWQQLGMDFGMNGERIKDYPSSDILNNSMNPYSGGIDRVHRKHAWFFIDLIQSYVCFIELVFRASRELESIGKIGYKTLQSIQQAQGLDGNPLYAIIHEAIYCQGSEH